MLGGTDAVQPQGDGNGGVMWFRPPAAGTTAVGGVGLDMVLWERMRWEVGKGGWVAAAGSNGGGDELERIERVERRDGGAGGLGQWSKFACYLLVERFVLRRTDCSVALVCEFRFTNKIRSKWV
ncbi:hypothetical protein U9M48_000982 [Paspalum notatum var. saurae]|uniref:Uncharacterized protein n=1 Tax=Paspalum notatum var. saurae TaxID=547442 RepID=A0AAQ3PMP5_PASNO